mmetsp:Transcript_25891/g.31413  ORF Transcript_25891/g.31413 Transcript_25891/m.31413 type:complete len:130 (-) Transcript_25891:516-905(-)
MVFVAVPKRIVPPRAGNGPRLVAKGHTFRCNRVVTVANAGKTPDDDKKSELQRRQKLRRQQILSGDFVDMDVLNARAELCDTRKKLKDSIVLGHFNQAAELREKIDQLQFKISVTRLSAAERYKIQDEE